MADDVTLKIGADTSEAEKNLKNLEKNSHEISKSMGNAFGAIKAAAAAAVAVFAGKQVLDFFSSGIDAAVAQEQAMAGLAQQLKLTGEFSEKALSEIAAFGDEMERTSQFGDDVVISQVAVAKSFGITNDQAQELVRAAIELSAATGDSLESSVEQLGKTFDGVAGKSPALKNALSGVSEEALRAGEGLKVVLDRFGGSAEAQIQTFAGSIKQAENAFGNLQEAFGKVVTENAAVLAAIQVARDIFSDLQVIVEENQETINDFITGGLQVFATSMSVTAEVVGFFIRALQGLATVSTLVFTGMIEVVKIAAEVWAASYGSMIEGVLKLTDAIGLTDGAADDFNSFIQDSIKGLDEFSDKTAKFGADNVEKFNSFNEGFEKFQGYIDEAAVKIFAADKKTGKSGKDAAAEREKAFKREIKISKDREKAVADFIKFEKQLIVDSADAQEKAMNKLRDNLTEIDRAQQDSIVSAQRAEELKFKAVESYNRDFKKIQEEMKELENKRYDENIKAIKRQYGEQVEIVRAGEEKINKILNDKITTDDQGRVIQVETVLSKEATDLLTGMASSIVGGISQGANGAASTIAGAVGGIVSFFAGPGFGSIIREILMLFFQDPAMFEEQIKGFAKAIPALLENFADNIANIVDIILEIVPELIPAIIRGFPKIIRSFVELFTEIYYKLIPGLIKIFFKEFLPELGGAISEGYKKALADIEREVPIIFDNIKNYFKKDFPNDMKRAAESIKVGFAQGIKNFIAGASQAGSNFFNGIIPAIVGIRNALNSIGPALVAYTQQASLAIGNALTEFRDKVVGAAAEFQTSMVEAFKSAVERFIMFFREKLPEAFKDFGSQISDAGKNFASGVGDAAQQFIDKIASFGGIGGGDNKDPVSQALGLATGITEVPRGYPNDTFAARLTSGERVVDTNTNKDLKDFLSNANGAGFGGQEAIALLRQIASKVGGGTAVVELTLDKKVLSSTILDLSRRNVRTTA